MTARSGAGSPDRFGGWQHSRSRSLRRLVGRPRLYTADARVYAGPVPGGRCQRVSGQTTTGGEGAAMYDLVVRGGRVIDPAQGLDAVLDVAISGHRIAAVGPDLAAGGAREVVEAAGLLVTPGMVDLHTHVFWGVPPLGVEPDPHCLARGVTTAVDAGSAGAATFPAFRRYIIDVSATRIVAM